MRTGVWRRGLKSPSNPQNWRKKKKILEKGTCFFCAKPWFKRDLNKKYTLAKKPKQIICQEFSLYRPGANICAAYICTENWFDNYCSKISSVLAQVRTQAPHAFVQKVLHQDIFLHVLLLCRGVGQKVPKSPNFVTFVANPERRKLTN